MIPNEKTFNGNYYFEFDGKTFYRYNRVEKKGKYEFRIKLFSKDSPYKQGIAITFSAKPAFKGNVLINGKPFIPDIKKQLHHVIPEELFDKQEMELTVIIEDGSFAFCNASDTSEDHKEAFAKIAEITKKPISEFEKVIFTSGFTAINRYGNSFWVERISEKKYRFHCNDHKMDDDFDDMIFDMEIEYSIANK